MTAVTITWRVSIENSWPLATAVTSSAGYARIIAKSAK